MAGGAPRVTDHLGIVELGATCAAMRARKLELFARLGSWVPTTAPGELQRLFAEACHRHAWHAELWGAREPSIPNPTSPSEPPQQGAEQPIVDGEDARRDRYRDDLSQLDEALRALRARVDPALDPSTARTIDLVGRDVVELAGRLDALRTR